MIQIIIQTDVPLRLLAKEKEDEKNGLKKDFFFIKICF